MANRIDSKTLLLCLLSLVTAAHGLQVCDQRLLNTFKLKGLRYAITDPMYICPDVKDRCCTLMDEIEIISMWKTNSQDHLRIYREAVARIYELLMEMHYDFIKLDYGDIPMHYLYFKKVPYQYKVCGDNTVRLANDNEYNREVADQLLPGPGKVSPLMKLPMVNDVINKQKGEYKEKIVQMVIDYIKGVKKVNQKWEAMYTVCTKKHTVDGVKQQICFRIRHFRALKARGLRDFSLVAENSPRKLFRKNAVNRYMQAQLMAYRNLKQNKTGDPKQLRELRMFMGLEAVEKLKKMNDQQRKKFERKLGFFKKIGKAIGDFFSYPARLRKAKKLEKKRQKKEEQLYNKYNLEVAQVKPILEQYFPFGKIPDYLFTTREIFIAERREFPFIKCVNRTRYYFHSFLLMNERKSQYCESVMGTIKKFKMDDFKAYFPQIRDITIGLLDLKKTMYCDICDAHRQRYFNGENRVIIYSQEFCQDVLHEYRDYFYWKNILLIEYLDLQVQFIECMQTAGNTFKFPIPSIVTWHKRRIFFIKRCLDNLNTKDFYRYCRFICVQFRYTNYSKFFDGDIEFLMRIFYKITKFIRDSLGKTQLTLKDIKAERLKEKRQKLKELMKNIKLLNKRHKRGGQKITVKGNKMKVKTKKKVPKKHPTLKGKPKPKKKAAKLKRGKRKKKPQKKKKSKKGGKGRNAEYKTIQMLGKKIVTTFSLLKEIRNMKHYSKADMEYRDLKIPHDKRFTYREAYVSDEIFEKVDKPYNMNCWRSFFSKHKNALNPFRDIVNTNFDFKLTSLIELQARRTKREQLNFNVLETYLKTNKPVQDGFNKDFDEIANVKIKHHKLSKKAAPKKEKATDAYGNEEEEISATDWFDDHMGPNSLDTSAKLLHETMHVNHDY